MRRWDLDLVAASSGDGTTLEFDSVVAPGADLSRHHVDAILGDVITPLAWTLMGPVFEHSQWSLWHRMGALGRRHDTAYRFAVRAGGRLHMNLAAMRELAARMPGASAADVDLELGLDPTGAAPVTWRDRAWYPRTATGSGFTFATLDVALARQRRRLAKAIRSGADLRTMTPAQLVDRIDALRQDQLADVMVPHHAVRMLTKVALDRLHDACGDTELANGLMADLPELEATEPSRALLRLADDLRRTGTLDDAALDAFVARFGHRGANELDPVAPVWAQQREQLAALVRRMAEGPEHADAATRGIAAHQAARAQVAARPRAERARISVMARVARRAAVKGERSKSDLARYVHELRCALEALRTATGLEHIELLGWDELRTAVRTGAAPDPATLARRRADLTRAAAVPDGTLATTPNGTVLEGIAASPGRAHGRAVVVHDPLAPLGDGDVLVAHATDTVWTPLFLTMRAVVTDTGQLWSHSSVVARDLGIPAVVNTGHATAVTTDGDAIDVDGDRGTVTVTVGA